MGDNVKKYFKNELRSEMFFFEHENISDFYLSCWQRNQSKLPLLVIRTLVFIGCVGTLISSLVISTDEMSVAFWFIFMTHWGLILITLTSGLALAVSIASFSKGFLDTISGLPLLVKLYWMVYNGTITIAPFITAFYWILLTGVEEDYAIDPVLDVFIHGINSVLMFVLLLTSRHPCRLMHFYFPLIIGITYTIFSAIYYGAGGLGPFGTGYIYPMLDWSQPGQTLILALVSAILMIVIHVIVVALTLARDRVSKRCRQSADSVLPISEDRYN